jgi:hypothetical protein
VAGGLGAEEQHDASDVLWVAESAERGAFPGLIQDLGRHTVGQPSRSDVPRSNGVDVDVLRTELDSGALRQTDETRLRRSVIGDAEVTPDAVHRRDIHDLTVLLRAHERDDRSGEVERAVQIRAKNRVPLVVLHVPQRPIATDARIVHQDVEPAQFLLRLRDKSVHVASIAYIAWAAENPDRHLPKLLLDLLGVDARLFVLVEEAERDVHP